jgi:hypothetical protein
MSLVWTNPSKSGLGDRFLDILIMLTYAKVQNRDLKMHYPEQPFTFTEFEKTRPIYRLEDYKLENIHKYMKLPQSLHIMNSSIQCESGDTTFSEYIGGRYSPFDIYNSYRPDISIYNFISIYLSLASEISFNFDYDLKKYGPYITVHLRRTDKVWDHCGNDHHGIKTNEVNDLNTRTCIVIDELISRGYKSIYFCGDDESVVNEYIAKYKDQLNIINEDIIIDDEVKKVYFDLYMLSNSKFIVLSQRHSSFSLFASMIKQTPLIYLYHGDILETASYTNFPHIVYYEELFKPCYILGHQGIGDLFSQNSIYNHYADIYTHTTIFVLNDIIKKVIDSMFADKKNIECIIPVFNSSSHGNTCMNCHTYGGGSCPRNSSRSCVYLNESKYHNGRIIKLSAFRNFSEWLAYYNSCGNFVDCFYKYQFFNKSKKIQNFSIYINNDENKIRFESLYKNKPYALVHDTPDAKINTSGIDPTLDIIQLHQISEHMTDIIKLFYNATEIHMIDSSYSLLLYYLSFSNIELKEKIVFLHTYARPGRDIEIYRHPILENWTLL